MRDAQNIREDCVKDITGYQMGRVWLYELSQYLKLIQQSSKLLPIAFKRPRYCHDLVCFASTSSPILTRSAFSIQFTR